MMLSELSGIAQAALPISAFKEHLHLGSGFADDGAQDSLLEALLRAAIAAVEARTDKATITRDFIWTVPEWRLPDEAAFPVAPVLSVTAMSIVDRNGASTAVDPAGFALIPDTHRPHLAGSLPSIPSGGVAEVQFSAGYGTSWGELPADLAQAVFLLGAHYYEHRHDTAATERPMPHGANALLQRYTTVRILGGGV